MMNCPRCNSAITVQLNLIIVIPGELLHRVSKTALRRKDVQILGADWDRATYVCSQCDWVDRNQTGVAI